jgi:hypothetical protein
MPDNVDLVIYCGSKNSFVSARVAAAMRKHNKSVTDGYSPKKFAGYLRRRQLSFGSFPVTVGTIIADRPPYRSVRAELPHTAPTSDE